jgi:hypothetical protein
MAATNSTSTAASDAELRARREATTIARQLA